MHQVSIVITPVLRLLCLLSVVLAASPGAWGQEAEVRVEGRVLLFDGSPAQGANVHLVTHYPVLDGTGIQSNWSGSMETGSDGKFSLSYSPWPLVDCVLTANLEGHEPLEWTWSEHPSEGPKVLSVQSFPEPCYLTGSIVGGDGDLLTDGWTVIFDSPRQALISNGPRGAKSFLDQETGQFRIGPVVAGEARVFAKRPGWGKTEQVTVDVRPGEPTHVVLRYTGEDRETSIYVGLDSAFPGMEPGGSVLASSLAVAGVRSERSYLFLVDSAGQVMAEASPAVGGHPSQLHFVDVPVGLHAVELRHPWFHPVRIEGVIPGKTRSLWVGGNAEILLSVLSSQGTPLKEYELAIRYDLGGLDTATYSLVPGGVPVPRNGRFQHIVPGKAELVVKRDEREQVIVDLGTLQPGEMRRVEARLAVVVPMEVQVLDASGLPAEGIGIRSSLDDAGSWNAIDRVGDWTWWGAGISKQDGSEELHRTDAHGRVTLNAALSGPWTLRVFASKHVIVTQTVEHPRLDEGPVVLRLPPMGRIEGKLRGPIGFDWSAVQLDAMSIPGKGSHAKSVWPDDGPDIDAAGSFAISGLPLGVVYVVVNFKEFEPGGRKQLRPVASELIEVGAGSQQWELDLTPLLPAKGLVDIAIDGLPQGGLKVALVDASPPAPSASHVGAVQLTRIETVTGTDGRAVFAGLNQGKAYTAFVTAPDATWVAVAGTLQGQTYSKAGRLSASLKLIERQLLVRSLDGKPLVGTELAWACQGKSAKNGRATTSSEGTMILRMPSGTYSLSRTDGKRPKSAVLEWRAGEEPLVIDMPKDER